MYGRISLKSYHYNNAQDKTLSYSWSWNKCECYYISCMITHRCTVILGNKIAKSFLEDDMERHCNGLRFWRWGWFQGDGRWLANCWYLRPRTLATFTWIKLLGWLKGQFVMVSIMNNDKEPLRIRESLLLIWCRVVVTQQLENKSTKQENYRWSTNEQDAVDWERQLHAKCTSTCTHN